MRILNIDKTQIPLQMFVIVDGEQYTFLFDYNVSYDFFTVSLSKDEQEIVTGEKMVLSRPLFTTINKPFETTFFIPLDLSGLSDRISYDNFGDSVYLWVFELRDGVIVG